MGKKEVLSRSIVLILVFASLSFAIQGCSAGNVEDSWVEYNTSLIANGRHYEQVRQNYFAITKENLEKFCSYEREGEKGYSLSFMAELNVKTELDYIAGTVSCEDDKGREYAESDSYMFTGPGIKDVDFNKGPILPGKIDKAILMIKIPVTAKINKLSCHHILRFGEPKTMLNDVFFIEFVDSGETNETK